MANKRAQARRRLWLRIAEASREAAEQHRREMAESEPSGCTHDGEVSASAQREHA